MHEEEGPPTCEVQKPVSKARTLLLMKDIQRLFFPHYRGKWYTIRPIHEEVKP